MSRTDSSLADRANELATKAQNAAKSTVDAHVNRATSDAADRVNRAARSTKAAAAEFDPASVQAEALRHVSDRIEELAARVRTSDLDQIVSSTTDFARKNPLLFLGAAAAVGFAATRFLRASEPRTAVPEHDPWSTGDLNLSRGNVGGRDV